MFIRRAHICSLRINKLNNGYLICWCVKHKWPVQYHAKGTLVSICTLTKETLTVSSSVCLFHTCCDLRSCLVIPSHGLQGSYLSWQKRGPAEGGGVLNSQEFVDNAAGGFRARSAYSAVDRLNSAQPKILPCLPSLALSHTLFDFLPFCSEMRKEGHKETVALFLGSGVWTSTSWLTQLHGPSWEWGTDQSMCRRDFRFFLLQNKTYTLYTIHHNPRDGE